MNSVDYLNLLLTISVMMKTTLLHVIGIVEHVVKHKMMDGITFAQNADVFVSERYFKCGITLSAHIVGSPHIVRTNRLNLIYRTCTTVCRSQLVAASLEIKLE